MDATIDNKTSSLSQELSTAGSLRQSQGRTWFSMNAPDIDLNDEHISKQAEISANHCEHTEWSKIAASEVNNCSNLSTHSVTLTPKLN